MEIASAGSYCYGNGASYSGSPSDNQNGASNIDADICPAGWHMPTGNTSGKYSALANTIYDSTGSISDATAYANYRAALHIPLSGNFYNGTAYYHGSVSYSWSSTRYNDNRMYLLNFSTSDINPAYSNHRDLGFSVRCLLK